MSTVVIGLGNAFRSDDAAGLLVARRVRERTHGTVAVVEHEGDPADLMDLFELADTVVVVDAVRTDAPPGHVVRFMLDDADGAARTRHSSHALGLREAVALARTLGRAPASLVVFGIAGTDFSAGTDLSPGVDAGVEAAATQIVAELTGATPCA